MEKRNIKLQRLLQTTKIEENSNDEFIYDDEEAVQVIIDNISDELQEIWDGEYEYYDMNGQIGEVPLEEMN